VIATELMLIAGCMFVLKLVLERWGPTRMKGMASSGDAKRLLGVTRLRKVRAVVPARPLQQAPAASMKMIFTPGEVGWRLGRAHEPRGGELWVPWDRTTGVIGPQAAARPSTC
jgi:type IV secretion system protein VirD4